MLNAKNLLEFEYFPVELPESFSSKDIVNNYDIILGQIKATNYKSSVPYLFTVYKSENARRRMAIPNIYHYMKLVQLLIENDSDGKRKQSLPIVKSIEVTDSKKDTFLLGKESKESYTISLEWKYEKDLGYDTHADVTLVALDNRLYVVSYNVGDANE